MRRIIILLVAIVATIAIGAIIIVARGIGARNEPSAIETTVARTLRHIAIPSSLRDRRNPEPATPEVIAMGRAHWADHCAICHANDGSGDTEIGRNLYPRTPDMRKADTQKLSDGELFAIIRDGVRLSGMPAWSGRARDNWMLVRFIRHLPDLKPEEIREMEGLNPKSPAELEQKRREDEFLKGH
ncbi:MAG TPA: c-type cytochrome [Thermoanaerobaculia bacterium]|nr:c-type cytochrome [Thermoanaerobaculia bacterium]